MATPRMELRRACEISSIVMSTSGSVPAASAASSEFSTSSRMDVYKHLPGCVGGASEDKGARGWGVGGLGG